MQHHQHPLLPVALPQINRGGEFVFFVDSLSAGYLNFARGNARCDRLQDFGVPKEAGIFLTQSIHLRAGRVHHQMVEIGHIVRHLWKYLDFKQPAAVKLFHFPVNARGHARRFAVTDTKTPSLRLLQPCHCASPIEMSSAMIFP